MPWWLFLLTSGPAGGDSCTEGPLAFPSGAPSTCSTLPDDRPLSPGLLRLADESWPRVGEGLRVLSSPRRLALRRARFSVDRRCQAHMPKVSASDKHLSDGLHCKPCQAHASGSNACSKAGGSVHEECCSTDTTHSTTCMLCCIDPHLLTHAAANLNTPTHMHLRLASSLPSQTHECIACKSPLQPPFTRLACAD